MTCAIFKYATACALAMALLPASEGQSAQFSITGKLLNATTGDAVPGARLVAETSDEHNCPGTHISSAEATSDAQGVFSIAVPCAGIWHLTASGSGFPTQDYEQHESFYTGIVLTKTQPTLALNFLVTPVSVITGFVLDEAGEPVREARLTLLNANLAASQQRPTPMASAETDDRGFYEFPNLLPGNYLISVQAQPWYAVAAAGARNASSYGDPNLDLAYPITYFPGTADPFAATAVTLAPGSTQQADIRLTPVQAIHMILPSGERPGAMFGRNQNGPVPLTRGSNGSEIEAVTPFGGSSFQPTSTFRNEDGSVDVGGFAPGSYQISEGRGHGRESERTVTLARDAGHAIALARAPDAAPNTSGATSTLRLAGSTTLNSQSAAGTMILLVAATPPDAAGHFKVFRAQSNTDGSFTLPRIPAGNYILVAIQNGWALHWTDPAVLSNFLLKGTPLQLNASTTLPHPIAAQSATP
jgi:hypothetical protein